MRGQVILWAVLPAFFVSLSFGYDWSTNLGTGDPNDPYQISTPEQLMSIGSDPNLLDKCFILVNDIVFDPNNNPTHVFTSAVIAPSGSIPSFTGSFDGSGYAVCNLKIQSNSYYLGLFGSIEEGSVIKNLDMMSYSITGINRIGGLAGVNNGGTITYCSTSGNITGQSSCGGLIGTYLRGTIANCSAQCEIIGGDNAQRLGGLVGYYLHSEFGTSRTISDCYAEGNITGGNNSKYIGGLIGYYCVGWRDDAVLRCHANVNIEGGDNSTYLGGLIGYHGDPTFLLSGRISDSHATGHVTGGSDCEYLGGLVGQVYGDCELLACYAAGNVTGGSGSDYIGGLCGIAYTVSDCNFIGVVRGTNYVGGLIGSGGATIENGSVTGSVEGISGTGGLVGQIPHFSGSDFLISNCSFNGSVTGSAYGTGGLIGIAGENPDSHLTVNVISCRTEGTVSSEGSCVGGLIGRCQYKRSIEYNNTIIIENCETDANVIGLSCVGGIVGLNMADLQNCHATGQVQASSNSEGYAGGLVGYNAEYDGYQSGGNILNCYATGDVINGSGLIGYMAAGLYDGHVSHCYATGDVTNGSGLIGACQVYGDFYNLDDLIEAPIESCYATGNVVGSWTNMGGLIGFLGAEEVYSVSSEPVILIRDCYYAGQVSNDFNNSGGLYLHRSGTGGLIGVVRSFGTAVCIESCTAEADVDGFWWVGGLIGTTHIQYQLIYVQDCHVSNTNVSGVWGIGGLVGYCDELHVLRCSACGSVNGERHVGGLIGIGQSPFLATILESSFADTTVHVLDSAYSDFPAGGFVGSLGYALVDDCYAKGIIYAKKIAGGLIGNSSGGTCRLTNCLAAMQIDSPEPSGGLIGATSSQPLACDADITNCFWDMDVDPNSIDNCGDHGRTTAELMNLDTFKVAGWDFVGDSNGDENIWRMCVDGVDYPRLSWEYLPSDLACPDGVGIEDADAFGQCWLANVNLDTELDDDGDTVVSLSELARIGQYWLAVGCGDCGGMDLTGDGEVTMEDLSAVAGDWLAAVYPECGMADLNGDDFVDLADWAIFAAWWTGPATRD